MCLANATFTEEYGMCEGTVLYFFHQLMGNLMHPFRSMFNNPEVTGDDQGKISFTGLDGKANGTRMALNGLSTF